MSMEYHCDYFKKELKKQKEFCNDYILRKGRNPKIIVDDANPMTIRTISAKHALSDIKKSIKPIIQVQRDVLNYPGVYSQSLHSFSNQSGSACLTPIVTSNDPSSYPLTPTPFGSNYVYNNSQNCLEFNKPVSIFNVQTALYNFYICIGSCLDRTVREVGLLSGRFRSWEAMKRHNCSVLKSPVSTRYTIYNNCINTLVPLYNSTLRTAVQIRHLYSHRGFVEIHVSNNMFYFNSDLEDTSSAYMPDDILSFSNQVYKDCMSLIDKSYMQLKTHLNHLR